MLGTYYLRKYKIMILLSILFFYLGCGITLSFIRMDCVAASQQLAKEAPSKFDKIEYAVLVLSGPGYEAKRDAIRATWANFVGNIFIENEVKLYKWNHTWVGYTPQRDFIKVFFVVGTQGLSGVKLERLKAEHMRSDDLLLLDNLEDNYKNLAVKLKHSLQWAHAHLKFLKYLIKCDDDSFLRVDLIVKDLEAFAPNMNDPEIHKHITKKHSSNEYKGLYWGYFDGRARVYLNGKWEEKDWFLCDTYLPYALGGGYIISKSIVDYIARNADFLSHYNSEDVSMGVWTAALEGINRVHDIRFDTQWKSRGCENNMLVRHKQTPTDMFQMYRTLVHSHGEKLCKTENALRKYYFYDWNVLPSMCCK
ncbi:beta-1,3-galactosyltransferase 6 [Pieris napi]|uniref:beta-1,3-galactosyltransferase 6 n=1 Tax=Pieris napi TaxID=78633 RepID=UPI001FB8BC26|nr:beta-1,3-galactosyltransferase 6 [Pieris napi]XP_047523358.1 beta-1,3-galactosyltransferase 6 [Pieris napi]